MSRTTAVLERVIAGLGWPGSKRKGRALGWPAVTGVSRETSAAPGSTTSSAAHSPAVGAGGPGSEPIPEPTPDAEDRDADDRGSFHPPNVADAEGPGVRDGEATTGEVVPANPNSASVNGDATSEVITFRSPTADLTGNPGSALDGDSPPERGLESSSQGTIADPSSVGADAQSPTGLLDGDEGRADTVADVRLPGNRDGADQADRVDRTKAIGPNRDPMDSRDRSDDVGDRESEQIVSPQQSDADRVEGRVRNGVHQPARSGVSRETANESDHADPATTDRVAREGADNHVDGHRSGLPTAPNTPNLTQPASPPAHMNDPIGTAQARTTKRSTILAELHGPEPGHLAESTPNDPEPHSAGSDGATIRPPGPRRARFDRDEFDIGVREPETTGAAATATAPTTLPRPMSTRVFVVANQKGGVGKTTTAVNLAAGLALGGLDVLVIDLDPQGNASTALGIDHTPGTPGTYEVLIEGAAIADHVVASPEAPHLRVLPATIDLAGAEIQLVSTVARENRLRKALRAYLADQPVDYVFLDCPPSLGLITLNALVAATEILIPIQCEYYALEGVSQLVRTINLVKGELNESLEVTTVLLTMYDARTRLAAQVAEEVRAYFADQTLPAVIPRSVRISEAPSYGQTVLTYHPDSAGAVSYLKAAHEIAQRAVKESP